MNRLYKTAIAALVLGLSTAVSQADTVTFDDAYSDLITNGINVAPPDWTNGGYYMQVPSYYIASVATGVSATITPNSYSNLNIIKYGQTSDPSTNDHTSAGTSTSGVSIYAGDADWPNNESLLGFTINFSAPVYVPSFFVNTLAGASPITIQGFNGATSLGSVNHTPGDHGYFTSNTATTYAQVQDFASTQVTSLAVSGYYPFLDDLTVSLTPAPIPTSTWNVNSAGDWNNAANWDTPGLTKVVLGSAITASHTLYINSAATVANLTFDNATASYFVQGTSTLNVNNGVNAAQINVLHGTHVITPGTLHFVSNTDIVFSNSSTLTIGGYVGGVVIDAGKAVTKSGTGTLNVIGKVQLGAGSSLTLAAAPSIALASTLSSDGISGAGTLDLTNNKAIIHGGSLSVVEAQIASGQISSSFTSGNASVVAVGSLTGADYLALTGSTFGGQAVVASDVLAGLTYAGDINLDGTVSAADLASIKLGGSHWVDGDFNHDGTVTFADVALADAAYKLQSGSVADAVVAADALKFGAAFDAAYNAALLGGAPGAVPEPASLALLGLGAVALLKRRK